MLELIETEMETLPGIGGLDAMDTEIDPWPAGRRAHALDPDRTLPPPNFFEEMER